MTNLEGYVPSENSAAKDIVMDVLDQSLSEQGIDPYDEDTDLDLIALADDVVEALLKAGVTVPEGLESPFAIRKFDKPGLGR